MKTGRKRIISSIIFSCLAVITQSTAFATSQGLVGNSNPAIADPGKSVLGLQQYETDGPTRIRAVVSYGLQNRFQVQGRKIREV
ncbi:MAG: hypothetical protein EBY20_12120, partial [Alphaproteobacteria bacterium]|nr:hypothetical protein [Alphaproteobacteria bacterium]